VSRTADGSGGGFSWAVEFVAGGDLETIVVEDSGDLMGNDARVVVCTDGADAPEYADCAGNSRSGNELRGAFTVTLLGHTTAPIEYDADQPLMKRRLEELPNVGTVSVARTQTCPEKTYQWAVTFTSNPGSFPPGSGDMALLEASAAGLTTTNGLSGNADVSVSPDTDGSARLDGTYRLGYDPSRRAATMRAAATMPTRRTCGMT